ncbi:MAG: histidine kinase [Prochlorotrichaceae cyanobacterium]|jgi:two-component system clock-associated histidine kinase SasA
MEDSYVHLIDPSAPLQLLLFVDDRYKTKEELRKVRVTLENLTGGEGYSMEEVNVAQEPHLTEYYKVVATPTLIRIYPTPRQILAGADLAIQLEHWWPSWQELVENQPELTESDLAQMGLNNDRSALETLRLSDEIFRLKQENLERQSQIRFKDRVITILAHDLRNPLTAALLAIDTLLLNSQENKQTLDPKLVRQLLTQGRRQLGLIDHMITDLLESGRSTNKKFIMKPEKISLGELCHESIEKLKEQWRAKSQTVKTDVPSDIPPIYVDRERIQQVLMNLLDNAIKYTPQGGTIHLSVLHRTTQKVQVSICDNGPGIPEEQREQIFEDAFRLERDAEADGYGIGLSLCQKIVQAHYGKIWVDSISGQGSCFHFTLPAYPYPD